MIEFPGDLPEDFPDDQEYWTYWAPALQCRNSRNQLLYYIYTDQHHDICRQIPLPFPILLAEPEDRFDWPDDEWKRTVSCIDCGQVHEYDAGDVSWIPVRKLSQSQFRNETNCFSVKLGCAQTGCVIPVEFHIEIFDKTEDDLRREIKKGFVGKWPLCGHPALAAPRPQPKIERVYLGPI